MLDFKLLDQLHLASQSPEQTVDYLVKNSVAITHKKIKNSLHIQSLREGFEIEYENEKLNTIFLYFIKQKQK